MITMTNAKNAGFARNFPDDYAAAVLKAHPTLYRLATEAEIAQMSDQQIYQYIFKPGFSTAAQVTSVSGRGVGMDVVRTNIEKIGGTIDLKSTFGKGSTVTIKIPLTLAIVSALIVECASERFAIPQISVVELVRAAPGSVSSLHTSTVPSAASAAGPPASSSSCTVQRTARGAASVSPPARAAKSPAKSWNASSPESRWRRWRPA
jgi:hypothetical protein